ncbi:MAG: Glu-tRNA(Gln) amidotransferase subunit GatE [Bacteroidetes bacterium]|nr:Glu-tRNA(Gln) amidotransferase subunit GatE [Bacteroidota bacterium]
MKKAKPRTNKKFTPLNNYNKTKKEINFVSLKDATDKDYERIGFKSGLEIHQQLKTKEKLFCHCPTGLFNNDDDFDAEVIRHMRPALSELGGYDGTALMEFRTRKNIFYHIKNETACTYEVDDTPPFIINKEALEYALRISLLSKFSIVGEVHITRKQYLDGSIPTGFQRTAILGVDGEIQLKNKKIGLIQLSIEEDACREVSDIGHNRVYKTDRLGMPLIETVTQPECLTPYELMEAADYIRFLNRSTGKVRTGMGAAREDVNISCTGGTRVEIKGVAHNKWIPALSHNEAFRQWALLNVKNILNSRVQDIKNWKISSVELNYHDYKFNYDAIDMAEKDKSKIYAVNLPSFKGLLSHFIQPNKIFANEIIDRLKVIACLEKPNMTHSEDLNPQINQNIFEQVKQLLNANDDDAQIIFWGPEDDITTALETIEERCLMAFEGIPSETRKSLPDGTTIFERVLPGADRMYPDTDSAPIPLEDEYIEKIGKNLPVDIFVRIKQLNEWKIPEDTHNYILKKDLAPIIEKIINNLKINPKFVGTFFGHTLKHIEGQIEAHPDFTYDKIYDLFEFIKKNKLDILLSKKMLPVICQYPNMDFESVLTNLHFKRRTKEELLAPADYLIEKFKEIKKSRNDNVTVNWVMGQIHNQAIGNISLKELKTNIEKKL